MSGLNGELQPVSPLYLAVLGYLNSHGCRIHFDSRSCLVSYGKVKHRVIHEDGELVLCCFSRHDGSTARYDYLDPMMFDKVYEKIIGKPPPSND